MLLMCKKLHTIHYVLSDNKSTLHFVIVDAVKYSNVNGKYEM